MLPDMDDSTIMPQIIPQIASLLLKINVPHCLVTAEGKFPRRLVFAGGKVYNNRRFGDETRNRSLTYRSL